MWASVAGLGMTTAVAVVAADWTRRLLDLDSHSLILFVPVAVVAGMAVFAGACGVGALALDARDRRRRIRG